MAMGFATTQLLCAIAKSNTIPMYYYCTMYDEKRRNLQYSDNASATPLGQFFNHLSAGPLSSDLLRVPGNQTGTKVFSKSSPTKSTRRLSHQPALAKTDSHIM